MKINLGCGSNRLHGWTNCDSDVDITKRLPFPDNSAEMILAEHVFEHISCPDGLRFLDECYRVLKSGGALRLLVPVLDRITDRNHARDLILGHGHQCAYSVNSLRMVMAAAGFNEIIETHRLPSIDGHWRVIGPDKDELETCRLVGSKP